MLLRILGAALLGAALADVLMFGAVWVGGDGAATTSALVSFGVSGALLAGFLQYLNHRDEKRSRYGAGRRD